jgi:hypothetical protein
MYLFIHLFIYSFIYSSSRASVISDEIRTYSRILVLKNLFWSSRLHVRSFSHFFSILSSSGFVESLGILIKALVLVLSSCRAVLLKSIDIRDNNSNSMNTTMFTIYSTSSAAFIRAGNTSRMVCPGDMLESRISKTRVYPLEKNGLSGFNKIFFWIDASRSFIAFK